MELPPWQMDLMIVSTEGMYVWEDQWHPVTGVSAVDFTVDVRNVALGTGAGILLKPAIQYAAVRTDRPGAGATISAGSDITGVTNPPTHYEETLSGGGQFFFRRGFSYKLSAGSFARASVLVYTAFRSCGKVFAPKEVVVNPLNSTDDISYFPITGTFPAVGVDKAKYAVIGVGNANADLEWNIVGRSFNDPLARGDWEIVPNNGSWRTPSAGDFIDNTGEVDLTDLSLGSFQWMELGLAVRKGAGGDPNSRCIFRILPAIKYT